VIKPELVRRIAGLRPHLRARDVDKGINAIFDEITAALARGDRVKTPGLWRVCRKDLGTSARSQSENRRERPCP
jgi:hypothetical protein